MRRDFDVTRRRFMVAGAALATTLQLQHAAFAAGFMAEAEVCKLITEQEEGPFYIGGETMRSDITEGKVGVPLTLRLMVMDVRTCQPLKNAAG